MVCDVRMWWVVLRVVRLLVDKYNVVLVLLGSEAVRVTLGQVQEFCQLLKSAEGDLIGLGIRFIHTIVPLCMSIDIIRTE
jgi:hypothetical protein